MTPEQFKDIWTSTGGILSPIFRDRLVNFNLQQRTFDFLTITGLPVDAAPYISFVKDTDDIYNGINKLTTQYDIPEPEYDRYIVIGSDGGGNPIAINTELDDVIEWLDHEDYFSSRYMNKSIEELASVLVIYKNFISQLLEENGEDAYLDANFTDAQFDDLKNEISLIDHKATIEDGFWKEELETLLVNRDYYRNQKA